METSAVWILGLCFLCTSIGGTTANLDAGLRIPRETPIDPNFVCPDTGFYPVSETACLSYYYACVEGVAYILDCPSDRLFDPKTATCEIPESTSCYSQTPNCTGPDGRYPISDQSCSPVYYMCAEGVVYEMLCPGTSVFDPDRLICASPDTVASCKTTTTSTTTTPATTTTTVTTTTTETTTSSSTTSTTTSSTTARSTETPPSTIGPFTSCTGLPDGNYPDPQDCNKYHVCVTGVDFPAYCNPGVCFDPVIGKCPPAFLKKSVNGFV